MQKRILCVLLCLVMVMGLLPTAFAAESVEVYVSKSGDDTGDGTKDKPYATLAKAVEEAADGATIYVMSDLTMTKCAFIDGKSLTITSEGETTVTITRGDNFDTQEDTARSWYNPAMIEVQTSNGPAGLTLTNIVLDDGNEHKGTVFAQAVSTGDTSGNTNCVQDAIIASNATVPCTITLGAGAVLRNFGGMSAVRATDQAKIVMESGSVIEDTGITRSKGATGSVGPAGAVWIQGGSFEMKAGAEIKNINGRAVYADGGKVEIGGTISGITANKDMWQGIDGVAIHLRGKATAQLLSGAILNNINATSGQQKGSVVYVNGSDFTMQNGSKISQIQGKGIQQYGPLSSTVYMDGEITGITNYDNALNINNNNRGVGEVLTCTIGPNGNIHDNLVENGAVYMQAVNGILDIYGKINNNTATGSAGGVYLAHNQGFSTATMYDGAEICNNAAEKYGGVVVSLSKFVMNGGTISGNTVTDNYAGVFVRNGGQFIMNGGTIRDNVASSFGGGITFNASDWDTATKDTYVPYVELNSGTVEDNLMNAKTQRESNDLAITSTDYGKADRYLSISDKVTIGNKAVYFQTGTKTVTPADDSLDIKLGNASNDAENNNDAVAALNSASAGRGWRGPLATFWAQRDGAATLTVGGLTLDSQLPVYVLALKVTDEGKPVGAPVQVYAAQKTSDSGVKFTLPDLSGKGYAIAVVQPTQNYGELTISGPDSIQEDKNAAEYSVTYTVTYTMSKSMKNIIEQNGGTATYSLTVNPDSRLAGTPDTATFVGDSISVTYTLPADEFAADKSLFTSAVLTIQVGRDSYTIPSNVAETKMDGLDDEDDDDWSPIIPAIVIAASQNKTPLKLNTAEHMAYVNGYPDGTVKPNGKITRAEVATILYRIMDAKCVSAYSSTRSGFSDVDSSKWYNTYVATLNNAGIITDSQSGYFRPDDAITRAELAAMLGQFVQNRRAANYFSDVSADHWAAIDIAVCANMGWITGYPDGTFRPDATITRAEMMAMVNRALERTPQSVSDLLPGMKTWSDNASTSAWYYLDVQEATNGHTYTKSGTKETWTQLTSSTSF